MHRNNKTKKVKFNLIKAMSSETSLTGSERLHNIVVSLGMEITDSIVAALRNQVVACRQEQKDQLLLVDPLLIAIDTVARHIDEVRARVDNQAFSLLNELVHFYQVITIELAGQEDACQAVVSASLAKVFAWQHSCVLAAVDKTEQSMERVSVADREEKSASSVITENMSDLLATVKQEIAATGMMAIRESASLLEVVHVQNEAEKMAFEDSKRSEGDEELGNGQNLTEKAGEYEKEDFNSLIQGGISSLQQVFRQEMERLRHEIIQE
jgi:hypothetical protein